MWRMDSIKSLREAVSRQKWIFGNLRRKEECFESNPVPENQFFHDYFKRNNISDSPVHFNMNKYLHKTESTTSQLSHWSNNLDCITSSIGDLKSVLETQDKQVLLLAEENQLLKHELKKKEKELKKQTFLLKEERKSFEEYKRSTCNEIREHKYIGLKENNQERYLREITKLRSEVTKYKQMYIEQCQEVNFLSKLERSLRYEKSQLKEQMVRQDMRYAQYIMEMAHRFNLSRKEFNIVISKKLESKPIFPTNLAVIKLADRNARLAHDNCMLKLEVNSLREQLFAKKIEKHKLQCLTARKEPQISFVQANPTFLSEPLQNECKNSILEPRTSASSKADMTAVESKINCEAEVSTKNMESESDNIAKFNKVLEKVLATTDIGVQQANSVELIRIESAPLLGVNLDES